MAMVSQAGSAAYYFEPRRVFSHYFDEIHYRPFMLWLSAEITSGHIQLDTVDERSFVSLIRRWKFSVMPGMLQAV